jgi:hypothetical protein
MKLFITILLVLVGFTVNAQVPDTCFTSKQVLDISYTLDSIFYIDSINTKLINEQKSIITDYKQLIKLDSLESQYKDKKIELLQSNINLYVEREKLLKPKWYQHRIIAFGGGMATVLITSKLINSIIK